MTVECVTQKVSTASRKSIVNRPILLPFHSGDSEYFAGEGDFPLGNSPMIDSAPHHIGNGRVTKTMGEKQTADGHFEMEEKVLNDRKANFSSPNDNQNIFYTKSSDIVGSIDDSLNILTNTETDGTWGSIKSDNSDEVIRRHPKGRRLSKTTSIGTTTSDVHKGVSGKVWDVFRIISNRNEGRLINPFFELVKKVVKIAVSIILCIFILGAIVVSKFSLLAITANLYPNITFSCYYTTGNKSLVTNLSANESSKVTINETLSCVRMPPETEGVLFGLPLQMEIRWVWALVIVACSPYVFTFIKSVWRACFKHTRSPSLSILILVMSIESLQATGICILLFLVLPNMDSVRSLVLMTGCATLPSFLKIFDMHGKSARKCYLVIFDCVAMVAQVSALIIWPIIDASNGNTQISWATPFSLLLISLGWWENFINKHSVLCCMKDKMKELKRSIARTRTKLYIVTSLWKIVLTLCIVTAIVSKGNVNCLKSMYFQGSANNTECSNIIHKENVPILSSGYLDTPFWLALLQVFSCLFCYVLAKNACKIMMQVVSFSIPVVLATPLTIGIVLGTCQLWKSDPGRLGGLSSTFWTCDLHGTTHNFMSNLVSVYLLPVVIAWWLSFVWITGHIWFPKAERLAQTDKLFVKPLYCGVLLEQSLALNRRRDDKDKHFKGSQKKKFEFEELHSSFPAEVIRKSRADTVPMIYICATMWHETEREMSQLIKSIFRMDKDQFARKQAQTHFHIIDPDYYEFEGHIFVDDAFEEHDANDEDYTINNFVKQLVQLVDPAASAVHGIRYNCGTPVLYSVPYGGRLEWRMPGGNKLIVHMKDKCKVRRKKRWSQVMYMYYLLGHKLVAQSIDAHKKQALADNTYILALDGDVAFHPTSVQLLVDRMKKNDRVGAACGRIHPRGTGPMIWYQYFEYAVSHWLQKATEHMTGCVLCSPGCFSLFRASALMDDNVMCKYALESTEAIHFVQRDQGEDRWLSTLLLKQGYKLEYCAAADAMTFAPEGFEEFFNQRRRWAPSTMANIMDLLSAWRQAIKRNDDISFLYIMYQVMLFTCGILTPGTTFLLIVGAINTAFPTLSLFESLFANLVPIVVFVIVCLTTRPKIQTNLAAILTGGYALVMMLVLIGLALEMFREGICSPTTIFLLFVITVFGTSALLHPQEFYCLFYGAVYFLAIPSMAMLLMIYSMCNMHVVSWGTRETQIATINHKAKSSKKKGKWYSVLSRLKNTGKVDSDYAFSFGNLFKCICCPQPVTNSSDAKIDIMMQKLEQLERRILGQTGTVTADTQDAGVQFESYPETDVKQVAEPQQELTIDEGFRSTTRYNPLYKSQNITRLSDARGPLWIQDEDLGKTNLRHLNSDENEFWKGLIDTYLKPLRDNPEQREKVERDLVNLRNKVSLFFFLSNALLIVVIFTLQYINSENEGYGLAIPIPCETIYGRLLTIEPISLLFMVIFGFALGIQFIAMFFHRMATFWHIMATTDARFLKAPKANAYRMEARDGIQLALDVMSHNDDDDDTKSVTSISTVDSLDDSSVTTDDSPKFMRRKTVQNIARKRKTMDPKGSLSTLFVDKLVQLADELHEEPDNPAASTAGGGSGKKRTKSKKAALLNKLKHNKSFVLSKADSVRSKWKKIATRAREKEAPPTDSWQALVQAALRQSRTSLASISEEGLHGLDAKTSNLHANNVVTQSVAGLGRANSYVSQASNSSHDVTHDDVIFEDDGDAESVIDVYEAEMDNNDEPSVVY